jgi:hypothetical protein
MLQTVSTYHDIEPTPSVDDFFHSTLPVAFLRDIHLHGCYLVADIETRGYSLGAGIIKICNKNAASFEEELSRYRFTKPAGAACLANKLRDVLSQVVNTILPVTMATLPSNLEPLEVIVAFSSGMLYVASARFVSWKGKKKKRSHIDFS